MKNTGFTIIESLFAISILVFAIVGATSAIQTGISSYTFSKDQIIAFYLAQEGFEQIRNIRAENGLNNRHWLTGISLDSSDPCFFGEVCTVDPVSSNTPIWCGSDDICDPLTQDPVNGFFGYNALWPATIFRREIMLTRDPLNIDEIAILVTVKWSKGLVNREFRVRENILNWQ